MSAMMKGKHRQIIQTGDSSPFTCELNLKVDARNHFNFAWHEEIEIKYIVSGSMTINLGTRSIRVKEGDVVVINPYEYHANVLRDDEEVEYHILCVNLSRIFDNNLFEKTYANEFDYDRKIENLIRDDELVKRYALEWFESYNKGDYMLSLGLFLALFSTLRAHFLLENDTLNSRSSRNSEIIHTAFSYIHTHFDEKIKLEDIAKKCYISEPHFCRVFKEVTGETPISYINSFKIMKAISLMKSSNMTIKQVAAAVGFDDEAYFCRFFKKRTGYSPRTYLKNCDNETSLFRY